MIRTIPCEQVPQSTEFRHLSTIVSLPFDLRYASTDNFMQRDMYSPLDCAWLHVEAAAGLERAMAWLSKNSKLRTRQRMDARLCVLDALRPQRVQQAMWDALDGTPLTQYLAPPERGSIHSYGMAVDVTLIDANGDELDMGTPFDDMTELSHPTLEGDFLKSGDLSAEQITHRHLLRDAMAHGGFNGIKTEWWHFDCGDRARVRETFARVL
jgi:zinc D-Ala-D-Ala dipeptidase